MGRTRSESSRRAVLSAVQDLLRESGYEALLIDNIVARAGVGRQTLYRWWRSKAAIVADAILDSDLPSSDALPDSGDVWNDLEFWVQNWCEYLRVKGGRQLVLALTAAAADDVELAAQLHRRFTAPQEHAILERLRTAQDKGQLSSAVAIEAIPPFILGSIIYHVLNRSALPDAAAARSMISMLLPRTHN